MSNLPSSVGLTVELTTGSDARWTARVKNTGDSALEVPADARLIALELKVPKKGTRVCELPEDMRPDEDEVGTVSLGPQKSVMIDFDPRLYCFAQADAEALVASDTAAVLYRLPGFAPAPATPRTRVKHARIASAPLAIQADHRAPLRMAGTTCDGSDTEHCTPDSEKVRVVAPPRIDGARAAATTISVTIFNDADKSRTAFVRPQSIGFLIEGAQGAFTCPVKGTPPIPELTSTLAPRGKASVDVLLGATCYGRLFERPGLYVVRPVFGTKLPPWAKGRELAGEFVGAPSLVRLHTATRPLPLPPPRLE